MAENGSTYRQDLDQLDERVLMQQTAAGDERAFAVLFDRYAHTLADHLFRLTRSREVAEDVVQDVFLKIWIAREALEGVRDFKSYIFMASKNQALNMVKKMAREAEVLGERVRGLVAADLLDDAEKGDMARKELAEQYYSLIDQAIEGLPPQQRRVFLLSRRDRLKYEEIAGTMEISRESVKKYLQHATRSISEYVRQHMDLALVVLLLLSEPELRQLAADF